MCPPPSGVPWPHRERGERHIYWGDRGGGPGEQNCHNQCYNNKEAEQGDSWLGHMVPRVSFEFLQELAWHKLKPFHVSGNNGSEKMWFESTFFDWMHFIAECLWLSACIWRYHSKESEHRSEREILKGCLSPPVFVSSDGWSDPRVWESQERRVFVVKFWVSLPALGAG